MKAVILAGGLGSRLSEETACGPSRWSRSAAADPLAHHEDLRRPRRRRLRRLPRLQGLHDQGVFRQLLPAHCDVTFDLADGGDEVHRSATEPWRVTLVDTGEGTMTGGRLKRVLRLRRRGGLLLHLWRRRGRHRRHRADRLPPRAGRARHGHRRAAPRPLRRARARTATRVRSFEEKPRGDGSLDQRRVLRALARGAAATSRAMRPSGSRSRCARWRRDGQLACLPPRRLLAGDGHAARPQRARAAVGAPGTRPVADLAMSVDRRRFWRRRGACC